MAFEYGSIDLGIRNPFKVEGAIRTARGVIISALGGAVLLQVKDLTASGGKAEAVWALVIGAVLLAAGVHSLSRGVQSMLRFFVGRGVPTSLASNQAKSEAQAKGKEAVRYSDQELAQMLQGRKLLTEIDPMANPLSRWICSLAESVLYLPEKYYEMAANAAVALMQSIEVAVLFAFAWFLGYTGLVAVMAGPVLGWTGIIMSLYLFWVWRKAGKFEIGRKEGKFEIGHVVRDAWKWSVGTLVATAGTYGGVLAAINSATVRPVPPILWAMLAGFAVLGIVTMGLIIAQIRTRAQLTQCETEVSEYRANWQESIRPSEVFIHFDSIVMANRRYKEMPNRVYRAFDTSLLEHGSVKGNFDGETIQETQPACRMLEKHPAFQRMRIAASAVGHGLIVVAGIILYLGVVNSSSGRLAAGPYWMQMGPYLLGGFMIGIFGQIITQHAHSFWSEVQFESLLIYFQCRGTYTESRLTTGKSVYDSIQSDNLVFRTSLTPWVVATRLVSSWFANTDSATIGEPRYMLEMHKADADLNTIMAELKQFISCRVGVVALETEKDVAAVAQIAEMNRQTRMGPSVPIPQEVRALPADRTQQANHEPPLVVGATASVEESQGNGNK